MSNKEITTEQKPLVSIVMATYNPNLKWFEDQLISLNNQTYSNLELIILDDFSTTIQLSELRAFIIKQITSMPCTIMRNHENIGSTRTFEKLTSLARGEYIAYCDQDDIWHSDKIESQVDIIEIEFCGIVYSEMKIIDEHGIHVADSLAKIRKNHRSYSGTGLEKTLMASNFVTGCAMMIRKKIALKAMPFCPYMFHDHWMALFTAQCGESIYYIKRPMMDYRIHHTNQSMVMAGVTDKASYLSMCIKHRLKQLQWLSERFRDNEELSLYISKMVLWLEARKSYFISAEIRSAILIWRYRSFGLNTSLFELICPYIPPKVFLWLINLKKKNII